MKRQRASLGELCTLIKGKSPISKTQPGPFPLVTTGEDRKTADTFQFDTEAVCIPLISSTGHGHASLKRVHYQSGHFALANLLAAALVNDRSMLSPRFLACYLTHAKDRLIVPLMTGAANMSLSIDRLATVPVEFPPLAEQQRIVRILAEATELQILRVKAHDRANQLMPAIFHDMFGDPTSNSNNWPLVTLDEIGDWASGGTPPRSRPEYFDGDIDWYSAGELTQLYLGPSREKITSEAVSSTPAKLFKKGSLLIGMYDTAAFKMGILAKEAASNQACANVCLDSSRCLAEWLYTNLALMKEHFLRLRRGIRQQNLSLVMIRNFRIPLPPLEQQKEFTALVSKGLGIERAQKKTQKQLEGLSRALMYRVFDHAL
jgi:type I restriction enzyme S subunit